MLTFLRSDVCDEVKRKQAWLCSVYIDWTAHASSLWVPVNHSCSNQHYLLLKVTLFRIICMARAWKCQGPNDHWKYKRPMVVGKIFIIPLHNHFCGAWRAQKLTKIGTQIKNGEHCNVLQLLHPGVASRLHTIWYHRDENYPAMLRQKTLTTLWSKMMTFCHFWNN